MSPCPTGVRRTRPVARGTCGSGGTRAELSEAEAALRETRADTWKGQCLPTQTCQWLHCFGLYRHGAAGTWSKKRWEAGSKVPCLGAYETARSVPAIVREARRRNGLNHGWEEQELEDWERRSCWRHRNVCPGGALTVQLCIKSADMYISATAAKTISIALGCNARFRFVSRTVRDLSSRPQLGTAFTYPTATHRPWPLH